MLKLISRFSRDREREVADARIGYQAALSLVTYEGSATWARFNVMLIANGVLLAAASVILTTTRDSTVATLLFYTAAGSIAVAGLALCGAWLAMTARGFRYFDYWILSARQIEENSLQGDVVTLSRGSRLPEGVHLPLAHETRRVQLNGIARFTSKRIAYFVISVFGLLYALLICLVIILSIFARDVENTDQTSSHRADTTSVGLEP